MQVACHKCLTKWPMAARLSNRIICLVGANTDQMVSTLERFPSAIGIFCEEFVKSPSLIESQL
jgi:hypothetical protein